MPARPLPRRLPHLCLLHLQITCRPAKLVLSKSPGSCVSKYKSGSSWSGEVRTNCAGRSQIVLPCLAVPCLLGGCLLWPAAPALGIPFPPSQTAWRCCAPPLPPPRPKQECKISGGVGFSDEFSLGGHPRTFDLKNKPHHHKVRAHAYSHLDSTYRLHTKCWIGVLAVFECALCEILRALGEAES